MRCTERHVVIGAGIAGCLTALMRRRAGYDVVLLERASPVAPGTYPICTGGSNIVSENHSGAEYPFDAQSARDCLTGRVENERFFPELIFGGKTFSRIIASQAMQDAGQDIIGRCRANTEIIRDQYRRLCALDGGNAVLGDPDDVCAEYDGPLDVRDVGAAFVTPQRGINSAIVSAVLEHELRSAGVDVRADCAVEDISRRGARAYAVRCRTARGAEMLVADQVSICSSTGTLSLACLLNPRLSLPPIYMALRQILYVDLPDGTDKDYTCLKLEDRYGGMLSPLNDGIALAYYPPAAHIAVAAVRPPDYRLPAQFAEYISRAGGDDAAARAQHALVCLRRFYPDLACSSVVTPFFKTAINTVDDSRIRRNAGVFEVSPGCTATVLLKWTMAVPNARRDLELALRRSTQLGTVDPDEVATLVERGTAPLWRDPPAWSLDHAACAREAGKHAMNMGIPRLAAIPFPSPARTRVPVAVSQ